MSGTGSTAVVNAGNINIQSSANTTGLAIPNTLSFTGGGTVLLGATKSQITGAGMLINSDNMIHGEGTLSSGSLAISNAGTIQADVAGKTLTINPSGAGADEHGHAFGNEWWDPGAVRSRRWKLRSGRQQHSRRRRIPSRTD